MVDLSGYAGAARPEIAHINAMVDAGWVAQRATDTPRDYLGGSRLGEECERRLGYEWHKVPVDEGKGFSGRTLRIFERGHDAEARMARYLREAGFNLQTEKPGGGQLGFGVARDPETGQARIAGHYDGVIHEWGTPAGVVLNLAAMLWAENLPYPLLWEHKGLKASAWQDLEKKGLKLSKPIYYAQVNIYMAYSGLAHAMFTAENQDTCEIYTEIVALDVAAAQAASDKGLRVVQSRAPEELTRCARSGQDFRCRMCPFAARCWAPEARKPAGAGDTRAVVVEGWGNWVADLGPRPD